MKYSEFAKMIEEIQPIITNYGLQIGTTYAELGEELAITINLEKENKD